jgi:DNA-binding GntR family transcriptional regulator
MEPMADSRLPELPIRSTVSDLEHVYSELKKAIMMGEFEPGQKLKLAELAQAFGTSQMPVREALGRLATAGALVSAQRRSMVIPSADVARLRGILSLRIDLEGKAVRLAMQTGREGLLERLTRANAVMDVEAARPSPSIKAYLAANHSFHFSIYTASGNRDLVDLIEILWMRYGPLLNLLRRSDVSFFWHAHHADLINAVKSGDPEAAVSALTADLEEAASLIAQYCPAAQC